MEPTEFEIGGRYRNMLGAFDVLGISQGQLDVQYESGKKDTLPAAMQARIISRMDREERSSIPKGISGSSEEAFAWTLGAMAMAGSLSAEVPPQNEQGFKASYQRITGIAIEDGTPGLALLASGDTKWGSQLRVYFPTALAEDERFSLPTEASVCSTSNPGVSRINSNAFFWHLVESCGFQLGGKQNVERIQSKLPERYHEAFLDGATTDLRPAVAPAGLPMAPAPTIAINQDSPALAPRGI